MFKFSQPVPIEFFIYHLLVEDRDVARIVESWNIERREVEIILVNHYRDLGFFDVLPQEHSRILKEDFLLQLKINPDLISKRLKIQKQIERLKSRQRR